MFSRPGPVVLAAYTPVRDAVALAARSRSGERAARRGCARPCPASRWRGRDPDGELEAARQRGGRATSPNGLPSVMTWRTRVGHELGDLARVDAAQAPADDRDLPLVARGELGRAVDQSLAHEVRRAEVAAEQPRVRRVARGASGSGAGCRSSRRTPWKPGNTRTGWPSPRGARSRQARCREVRRATRRSALASSAKKASGRASERAPSLRLAARQLHAALPAPRRGSARSATGSDTSSRQVITPKSSWSR